MRKIILHLCADLGSDSKYYQQIRRITLSSEEILALIAKARACKLTNDDQIKMAEELSFYRDAALRLEWAVHTLVKEVERLQGATPELQ